MKGTEKQVRWAEDIKANAINTCTANIERMSAQPIFGLEVKLYKVVRASLINGFEQIDDAAVIISNRARFDPSTINRMVIRVGELITNGKTTLEQFAAGSGINVADL